MSIEGITIRLSALRMSMLETPGAGLTLCIKADALHCVLARAPEQPGYSSTLGQLAPGIETLRIEAEQINIVEKCCPLSSAELHNYLPEVSLWNYMRRL